MCGFAGIVEFDGMPAHSRVLEGMGASLFHRGPDDSGVYIHGSVGLTFRRLSILDLSPAGHQPMELHHGNFVMVFNGEIYNYLELRRELEGRGCVFRSSGDSEVLLQAYVEWGRECLSKLNGMWAFLIYDKQRGVVFGARDRFGVKPLYRYRDSRGVCLASEIKAILAAGRCAGGIDWGTAAKFLCQGRLEEDTKTFYSGIEQIPPGTAFEISLDGTWKEWSYWSMQVIPPVDVADPVESFGQIFEDAVRLRMRSDVPVGVCLSGGLDSTSILCSMASNTSGVATNGAEPIIAFCYMPDEYDEKRYIRDTLSQTGAVLKVLQTDPYRLWDRLPAFLRFQDEPVHSMTALIGYELMGLAAANGVKVVLNGQGADETAAGYFSYFRDYWRTLLMDGQMGRAWNEIRDHVAIHGGSRPRVFSTALKEVFQWQLFKLPAYQRRLSRKRLAVSLSDSWFELDFLRRLPADEFVGMDGRLETALKQSVSRSPLPIYLRVEDRNSMAHSVEARLPFMDFRLVSLLFNLPSEWKLRGPWNKYILREAMRGRIPESVRARVDKMGFPTPVSKWLARDLYKPLKDVLSSRDARERGIYDVNEVLRDLDRHAQGKCDLSGRLFNVAQFEMWAGNLKEDSLKHR